MTAILQIRLHNLIHHTMNYNVIIVHRASGSRTIHSGTRECMPIFCHCLHNSRYAISLYQLMVLPSSASSAWGGKFFRPERCILSDNAFEALRCIKNNGIILLVCDIDIIPNGICYTSIEYDNLCAPDPIYYC